MFSYCSDPSQLEGLVWMSCYLTSGTHLLFYASFGTVLLVLAITAPIALLMGFGGALAMRSGFAPLRWLGGIYAAIVRGVPDIVFFLFVPIALDQGLEWLRSRWLCDPSVPVRQGNEFVVCAAREPVVRRGLKDAHQRRCRQKLSLGAGHGRLVARRHGALDLG